jgi:hypothetical protein
VTGAVWMVKLLAAPALIGLASLAGRRWGPNAAGLMGGLPLVGGPVVLALWLASGADYATQVSLAAPAGVWANIVYMLVLAYASAHWRWYAAIPLAWACYLASALMLNAMDLTQSLLPGLAVLPGLWLAATRGLPQPAAMPAAVHLPRIELFARMAAAAALVLTLSSASVWVGPQLTGILSGAPVAAVVIPAFTLANAGRDALLLTLRGFLTGLMGFTVFFLILGHSIPLLGPLALVVALIGGVGTGFAATRQSRLDLSTTPATAR